MNMLTESIDWFLANWIVPKIANKDNGTQKPIILIRFISLEKFIRHNGFENVSKKCFSISFQPLSKCFVGPIRNHAVRTLTIAWKNPENNNVDVIGFPNDCVLKWIKIIQAYNIIKI